MEKIKITPENVIELKQNEIFVFGSNLAGVHGAGAALLAKNKFGAVQGIGDGLVGQSYALPTKNENIETRSLIDIHKSIKVLLGVVKNSDKFFIITAVGCGLAGYSPKDIAPMFEPFIHLKNVSLPQSFIDVIFPKHIKGFKVTNSSMKCREFQYELGKSFHQEGDIKICNNGFHFCKELTDCFNYYAFNPSNRVFIVEGSGNYDFKDDKVCTENITFLEELNWFQVLDMVNTGKGNNGLSNSGDFNSGDRNSGDFNSGDRNSGYRNSGNRNSGDFNSGDFNSGDRNSGYFNNDTPTVRMFGKDTGLQYDEVNIPYITLHTTKWIEEGKMTEEEKRDNPSFYVTEGYLKTLSYKEAWKEAWVNLDKTTKDKFKNLPNFDADIFEDITGVRV